MEDGSAASRQLVDEACRQAAGSGRRVAVIFGADWCPDSRALDAALAHPLVRPVVAPGFVIVPIDVGNRDRNLEFLADFGMKVDAGIPAVAFLEASGELVHAHRQGELRHARGLSAVEIAEVFHRWLPPS